MLSPGGVHAGRGAALQPPVCVPRPVVGAGAAQQSRRPHQRPALQFSDAGRPDGARTPPARCHGRLSA